jgi:hypothetical protein
VSRRRDDEERRVDDAVEKLLLESADDAFSVMRVARARVCPARVADGSNACMARRDGAVTMHRLCRRPKGDDEEQEAAQRPVALPAETALC